MKETLLWLDDFRNPFENWCQEEYNLDPEIFDIVWVKTYEGFCDYISKSGVPDVVCFDNDLENKYTGFDALKWLTGYIDGNNITIIPRFKFQTGNMLVKRNMISYVDSWLKSKENTK